MSFIQELYGLEWDRKLPIKLFLYFLFSLFTFSPQLKVLPTYTVKRSSSSAKPFWYHLQRHTHRCLLEGSKSRETHHKPVACGMAHLGLAGEVRDTCT